MLHFRHLIEKNKIGEKIFDDVKSRLEKAGLMMHGGTIVDATIIAAPSSTKNRIHIQKVIGTGYPHKISKYSVNIDKICYNELLETPNVSLISVSLIFFSKYAEKEEDIPFFLNPDSH